MKIDSNLDYKMKHKETEREVIVPGHLVHQTIKQGFEVVGKGQSKLEAKDNFKPTKAKKIEKKEVTSKKAKDTEKTATKKAEKKEENNDK